MDNIKEVINKNCNIFRGLIDHKEKEGFTPAFMFFVNNNGQVQMFHQEGFDMNVLRNLYDQMDVYLNRVDKGDFDYYFPQGHFKDDK